LASAKRLDHTERDAGAANAAAGQRQCGEPQIVGYLISIPALFLFFSGLLGVDVRKTSRSQCFKFFA
jgi:hypothetical protein